MLEITTKENQIEIAVRLYENKSYGTTFGKGMYRRALFNGTIDARTPAAKYLVDCFNYADWSNQATTDEQMAVLAAVPEDSKKIYSWIKHYQGGQKRLVHGVCSIDMATLEMDVLICDELSDIQQHWHLTARPCKTGRAGQRVPQLLATNADLAAW